MSARNGIGEGVFVRRRDMTPAPIATYPLHTHTHTHTHGFLQDAVARWMHVCRHFAQTPLSSHTHVMLAFSLRAVSWVWYWICVWYIHKSICTHTRTRTRVRLLTYQLYHAYPFSLPTPRTSVINEAKFIIKNNKMSTW